MWRSPFLLVRTCILHSCSTGKRCDMHASLGDVRNVGMTTSRRTLRGARVDGLRSVTSGVGNETSTSAYETRDGWVDLGYDGVPAILDAARNR